MTADDVTTAAELFKEVLENHDPAAKVELSHRDERDGGRVYDARVTHAGHFQDRFGISRYGLTPVEGTISRPPKEYEQARAKARAAVKRWYALVKRGWK